MKDGGVYGDGYTPPTSDDTMTSCDSYRESHGTGSCGAPQDPNSSSSSSVTWLDMLWRRFLCRRPRTQTVLRVLFNGVTFAVWCTLVTYGSVKEFAQRDDDDMHMYCSTDYGTRPDCGGYGHYYAYYDIGQGQDDPDAGDTGDNASPMCCTTLRYRGVYNIVNLVGGAMGVTHVAYHASHLGYRLLLSYSKAVFLCQLSLRMVLFVAPFTTGMFAYQHAVYRVMFCEADHAFCNRPPVEYGVVRKVYLSIITFAVVFFLLQLAYVALFVWMFVRKRVKTWQAIMDIEDSLLLNGRLQSIFENRKALARSYDLRDFVTYWINKPDEQIIREIPAKTRSILSILRRCMDIDGDDVISREELDAYVDATNTNANRVYDKDRLWNIMTCECVYEVISVSSVEDLLYELFFRRKQLAAMIHTDLILLTSLNVYVSVVLYPICAIIVCRIFDYADAFNTGIDLFKTYAVIVSFLSSRLMNILQFLWLMFVERPFNKGDVLQVNGDTYNVASFNATHTFLVGATSVTISNESLLKDLIMNFSTNNISDEFKVCLPLNTHYDIEDFKTMVRSYMHENPRDIKEDSVRCGLVALNTDGKTLHCSYRYKFRVLDRSRLNEARSRIQNAFIANCIPESAIAFVANNIANGGGVDKDDALRGEVGSHFRYTLQKFKID